LSLKKNGHELHKRQSDEYQVCMMGMICGRDKF